MDFTQAHRAHGARRGHNTTEEASGQNDCGEPTTCLAGFSGTLAAVEVAA